MLITPAAAMTLRKRPSAHFDSGARAPGAPSSFQSLKKKLAKSQAAHQRAKKQIKDLKQQLQAETEEKDKEKKEKERLEGELGVLQERQQQLVNAALQRRLAALGIASTPWGGP